MKLSSLCIASAAVGLSCMAASSAVGGIFYEFEFVIDADQQVPPNDSEGIGFGFVTLVDETLSFLLSWDISWSDLSGPVTGMHFHGPADFGMVAGIQVDIGAISGLTGSSIGSRGKQYNFSTNCGTSISIPRCSREVRFAAK